METVPVPIVIVSVSVDPKEAATTFRALEAGALAAVPKPMGIGHPDYEETARTLVLTVKLMSEVKVVKRWPKRRWDSISPARTIGTGSFSDSRKLDIVAIGTSTGGPAVLHTILSGLPREIRSPILVVQHIAPGFVHGFAESLSISANFPARVPEDGEALLPGHVYLAPDKVHMGVTKEGRIKLAGEPPVGGFRPSVSYLFQSVADTFGPRSAGVLLTGMGSDGAEGLRYMKEKGAVTIAQNKESCVVFGMPAVAIRLGAADYVLSPEQIVSTLTRFLEVKSEQQ
jgi:two-component system, chemotaxis family, protein-glutamate methylesterase/glutaminase